MLPSWLQITPDLQLRALQAGTAAGSDIGRANQQRALAEIEAQQRADQQAQQAQEFQQRILSDQVRNRMDQAFKQQQLGQQRSISDAELALKGRDSAALNAIRTGELTARNREGDLSRQRFDMGLKRYEDVQAEKLALDLASKEALATGKSIDEIVREDPQLNRHPAIKALLQNELTTGRQRANKKPDSGFGGYVNPVMGTNAPAGVTNKFRVIK